MYNYRSKFLFDLGAFGHQSFIGRCGIDMWWSRLQYWLRFTVYGDLSIFCIYTISKLRSRIKFKWCGYYENLWTNSIQCGRFGGLPTIQVRLHRPFFGSTPNRIMNFTTNKWKKWEEKHTQMFFFLDSLWIIVKKKTNHSCRLTQTSFVYSQLDAVGWGRTTFGGVTSTTLQKVSLTVIPNTECNRSYPYQISSAQMCTFTSYKDTCDVSDIKNNKTNQWINKLWQYIFISNQNNHLFSRFRFLLPTMMRPMRPMRPCCGCLRGQQLQQKMQSNLQLDDGGPLFFFDTYVGRVYHVGIISYGTACASNMPRVHTRITSYLTWIQGITNGTANLCVI